MEMEASPRRRRHLHGPLPNLTRRFPMLYAWSHIVDVLLSVPPAAALRAPAAAHLPTPHAERHSHLSEADGVGDQVALAACERSRTIGVFVDLNVYNDSGINISEYQMACAAQLAFSDAYNGDDSIVSTLTDMLPRGWNQNNHSLTLQILDTTKENPDDHDARAAIEQYEESAKRRCQGQYAGFVGPSTSAACSLVSTLADVCS
jgi:hypothetical protein